MPRVQVEGFTSADAAEGQTLLEFCEEHGIPMECACGGFAACNSCRVEVLDGEGALSPVVEEEHDFLDAPNQRLGCQAEVLGDVSVRLASGM
ncbi:MAG: (2Fe-2S)-binding protein [Proteobacteria bacterium]|nr:(2Fe-2S)-binding protein [Pseudomonadota bacterium]